MSFNALRRLAGSRHQFQTQHNSLQSLGVYSGCLAQFQKKLSAGESTTRFLSSCFFGPTVIEIVLQLFLLSLNVPPEREATTPKKVLARVSRDDKTNSDINMDSEVSDVLVLLVALSVKPRLYR
jgi:hypothetical protein